MAQVVMTTSQGVEFNYARPHDAPRHWIAPNRSDMLVDVSGLELFGALADSFYIGPFRNAINQAGSQAYYDIKVGSDFVKLWDAWKSGTGLNATRNAKKMHAITETIQNMYGFSRLEVNANTTRQDFTVTVDGEILPLTDLGSGLAQCLIVLSNVAIQSPRMVFVDEPELNLHPALQQRFVEQLSAFAPDGIIFATHSLGLARSAAEQVYSFNKKDGKTLVHPYEGTPHLIEFLGELGFAAQQEIGYDRILLVEGLHDVKVFKQFLRRYRLDHKTVVLFLGGSQMAAGDREHELAELTRLTANVFAIADSEREKEGGPPAQRRVEFEASCGRAGIPVHLTKFRATENYFTDRALKKAKGDSYSALSPYELLKESKNGWAKSDNWKIAAEMSPDELSATDIGEFLQHVVGKDIAAP